MLKFLLPVRKIKSSITGRELLCYFSEGWCENFNSICTAVALYLCLIPEQANGDVEHRGCRRWTDKDVEQRKIDFASTEMHSKHYGLLTNSYSRPHFTSVLRFCLHYKKAIEPINQRTGQGKLWLAVLSPISSTHIALSLSYCYSNIHCFILIYM